jgi:hypothetical protein
MHTVAALDRCAVARAQGSGRRSATPGALPAELQRLIFVLYRVGLRRRMAQRRLQVTRRRRLHDELEGLFAFAHGWNHVVLFLLKARPA